MTRSLVAMADRLGGLGVTRVVLEATSDAWKPPLSLLEAHGFEVWLVNANDVKDLPGRPTTDRLEAVWLAKAAERQLLRPSVVPPPSDPPPAGPRPATGPIWWWGGPPSSSGWSRLLEDAQIKLSVVASDSFGASGRAMLAALVAGERDPKVLAQPARTRLGAKPGLLEEAFGGRFGDHHALLLQRMLARLDQASADMATLEVHLQAEIAPFQGAADRLDEICGVGRTAAQVIIAEIGVALGRFPTPGQLVSWARFAPGVKESAGRPKGTATTGHGNPLPGPAAGRTNTFLRGARSADRPTPRRQAGHRRGRPRHPDHRLALAVGPDRPLPGPRPWLLRHPEQRRAPQAPPSPPAPSARR